VPQLSQKGKIKERQSSEKDFWKNDWEMYHAFFEMPFYVERNWEVMGKREERKG